jgi:hypothetical protein
VHDQRRAISKKHDEVAAALSQQRGILSGIQSKADAGKSRSVRRPFSLDLSLFRART